MSEPFVPTQFGRYLLVEQLATGGMAEIFRAKSQGVHGFEKTVVIKRILPHLAADDEFVTMFVEEAKAMVRLAHPKVVQVLDFGEVEGRYFIAMEYVKGVDALALLRLCAQHKIRPTTGIAVHVAAEVLDALDYAHNLTDEAGNPLGVLHRDVSPSNIFISDLGEVKLGDFGIAIAQAARGRREARVLKGKYAYMAPEIVCGEKSDARADLFAVGVVLAEMLMVRRLFVAKNDLELLLQVRDASLHRLDKYGGQIPAELRRILDSALARDPATRYQDAATFRDALHRYLFDHRLMVRSHDVRRIVERLRAPVAAGVAPSTPDAAAGHADKPGAPATAPGDRPSRAAVDRVIPPPPRPTDSAPAALPELEPQAVVGQKRRIPLGPPPKPKPLPAALPGTGEDPRLGTADALAALPEVDAGGTSALHDFRTRETDEEPVVLPAEPPPPAEPRAVAEARMLGQRPLGPPSLSGELAEQGLVGTLFRLAVEEKTGLLALDAGTVTKEIYLVDGDPQFVNSNLPEELFGQYLVRKGVIAEGELAMALAMLPHFEGKLGNTLVALKLLRPMQVLRHLTEQVRQKLLDAFAWEKGRFAYYDGLACEQETAPLGLDAYEVIGASLLALPWEVVERRLQGKRALRLTAARRSPVPPEVFRLGGLVRDALAKLDGRHTLDDLLARYDDPQHREGFARVAYLLVETGLATVA